MAPFLAERANGQKVVVPKHQAFEFARVMARPDGFFVFELNIRRGQGFNAKDLDELAFVVSMITKSALGHVHYHHHLPGHGRQKLLKPTTYMRTSPVPLKAASWKRNFDSGVLTCGLIESAQSDNKRAPSGEPIRAAIVCLRHRYLRLYEEIDFVIVNKRKEEKSYGVKGLLGSLGGGFLVGVAINALIVALLTSRGMPDFTLRAVGLQLTEPALALSALALGLIYKIEMGIYFRDRPIIKLLRTAHGYFSSAQPLNDAIGRLPSIKQNQFTGFAPLRESIASKIEGEIHRVSTKNGQVALLLAVTALLTAIYAHTDARQRDISDRFGVQVEMSAPPDGSGPSLVVRSN